MGRVRRWWPWEPLQAQLPKGMSDKQRAELLAARLGLQWRTVHRAMHRASTQGLTDRRADAWACALGLHPINVWPSWDDPDRLYRELHAEWVVLRSWRTRRIERAIRAWEARRDLEAAFAARWAVAA